MRRIDRTLLPTLLAGAFLHAWTPATTAAVRDVASVLETPRVAAPGDGDDPSVWLHPTDASKSLVITAVKNGGLRVYDLAANEVQSYLNPGTVGGQASRLNNVDVQYNFRLADGSRADVAVFTDRGQDRLRMFRITDTPGAPLQEISASASGLPRLFANSQGAVSPPGGNPLATQATGYGLALWRDQQNDKLYALVTQRREATVAQFELTATADGFATNHVRQWDFPTTHNGVVLAAGSPRQFEGMVVDQQTGELYAAQEDVGIWKVDLRSGVAGAAPLVQSNSFDAASPLSADVEGLTIRYGANGGGVIIASSQGDSTFAAYSRKDFSYLGGFQVAATGERDAVDHSDGADVTSFGLPGFEKGLFVTHDGENTDPLTGAAADTNFKYVSWAAIADTDSLQAFLDTPAGFDPRNIGAVPEPAAALLWLGGTAVLAAASRRRQRRHARPAADACA